LTPPLHPKPQSGAALIVTLTLLLLITGLAISLFMTANTELQSASQFKNSQGLTELSDICVNLVMGQIKDATTTNAANTPATRSTWASQPGMIRTYASSTNAAMSYKLYSWDGPRVSGEDTTSVPLTWFSNPALYTDLNEPIPNSTNPSPNFYRYPIAYPPLPATDTTRPLGYDVLPSAPRSTGGAFTNQVPMPVQWLYVLKDGTMVYPTSASGNTATISGASAANPIVARVAYWTDDETSKVNINTAAGGEYWGPLVQKNLRQLTNSYWLPTSWEFQRYPGHPARTDLQAIFPDLTRQQIWAFTPRVSDNGATASNAMTTQPSSVAYDSDRLLASVGEARFSSTNTNSVGRADFTNNWSERIERNKFLITAASRAPEATLYGTPRVSIWPLATNTNTTHRTTLDSLFAFCSTIQKTTNAANPVIPTNRPYYFVRTTGHKTNQVSLNGDLTNSINTNMFNYLDSLSGVSSIPGIGPVGITSKYEPAGRDQLVTQFYDYIRCVNKIDTGLAANEFTGASSGGAGFVMPVRRVTSTGTNYGFGRFHTINQVAIHFICTADGDIPIFPNWSASSNYSSNSQVTYAQRYWEARRGIVNIAPGSPDPAISLPDTNNLQYPWKEIYHLSLWSAPPPAPNANFSPNPPPPAIHTNYTPILPGQVCLQAIAYIEPAMPGGGYPYSPLGDGRANQDYKFLVSGLNSFSLNGLNIGFHSNAAIYPQTYPQSVNNVMHGRSGGIVKYLLFLTSSTFVKTPEARGGFSNPDLTNATWTSGSNSYTGIVNRGMITNDIYNIGIPTCVPAPLPNTPSDLAGSYPLVSSPIRITKGPTMNLSAATINVTTIHKTSTPSFTNTYSVPFPAATIPMPTRPPNTNQWVFYPSGWDGTSTNGTNSGGRFPIINRNLSWETDLILPSYDTVFAVATKHGDYRISMARPNSPNNWAPVPANPSFPSMQHRLFNTAYSGTNNFYVPGANYPSNAFGLLPPANPLTRPGIPAQADLASGVAHPLTYGDFDNGLAELPDGPYINSPDEAAGYPDGSYSGWAQSLNDNAWTNATFFTPNRKIASPVAFGSLPSAAEQDRPWQNLLFRPAPGVDHPGKAGFKIDGTSLSGAPPDHVWLDFFWMPIVEPWAISETFSTAGKINMNYQIAPFSYIRRTTGVQAVLRTGGVTAISSSASRYTGGNYIKTDGNSGAATGLTSSTNSGAPSKIRDQSPFPVNLDETLKGFDARLSNNAALFRTASEICELPIVPVASEASYNSLQDGSWWTNWRYTGDNTKEATYNDIYPRLTTKSNTYTVHYRVQMLKKLPGGDQTTWDESKDKVASELRGSTLIERFLDPNATYPDYATAFSTSASLETLYRFRVLQRSQFTP
jgi:uncharacterized protein (TIGR02600 family)